MGKLGEYNADVEERLNMSREYFYFIANGITTAEKKKATFVSVIGPRTYKQLRTLICPKKPAVRRVVEDYYSPKPLAIVQ